MPLADTLYALLATGASLAAAEGAKTLGKSAVGDAYAALKARLTTALGARTVDLVETVPDNPALEPAIKADLARPEIAADTEVRDLARALEAAIEALPEAARAPYAVHIREIRAGRELLFEDVEGVTSDLATSGGDMTFRGIRSPGKP